MVVLIFCRYSLYYITILSRGATTNFSITFEVPSLLDHLLWPLKRKNDLRSIAQSCSPCSEKRLVRPCKSILRPLWIYLSSQICSINSPWWMLMFVWRQEGGIEVRFCFLLWPLPIQICDLKQHCNSDKPLLTMPSSDLSGRIINEAKSRWLMQTGSQTNKRGMCPFSLQTTFPLLSWILN